MPVQLLIAEEADIAAIRVLQITDIDDLAMIRRDAFGIDRGLQFAKTAREPHEILFAQQLPAKQQHTMLRQQLVELARRLVRQRVGDIHTLHLDSKVRVQRRCCQSHRIVSSGESTGTISTLSRANDCVSAEACFELTGCKRSCQMVGCHNTIPGCGRRRGYGARVRFKVMWKRGDLCNSRKLLRLQGIRIYTSCGKA